MSDNSVKKNEELKSVRNKVYFSFLCIPVVYVISITALVGYIIVKNTHSQISAVENLSSFKPIDFYVTIIMGFLISAFAIYQMFPVYSFFKELIGEDDLEISDFGIYINNIIRSQIFLLFFIYLFSIYTIPNVSSQINVFYLISFFVVLVLDILNLKLALSTNENEKKHFKTLKIFSIFFTILLVFLLPNMYLQISYSVYRCLAHCLFANVNSNRRFLGANFKKRIYTALVLLVLSANILVFFSLIDPILIVSNYVCAPFSIFKACFDKVFLSNFPKIVASAL